MVLIYFFGSKYNLKGFTFLDVLMHADKPYFNQEDCRLIDTMGIDYRVVIRDDSRIFPMDLNNYFKHSFSPSPSPSHDSKHNHIIVGDISDTSRTDPNSSIWDISTETFENNVNKNKDRGKGKGKEKGKSKGKNKDKSTDDESDNDDESDDDSDNELNDDDSESDHESDSEMSDRKTKIKGVNYFEANDESVRMIDPNTLNICNVGPRELKLQNDILDSIRDELNSAFED